MYKIIKRSEYENNMNKQLQNRMLLLNNDIHINNCKPKSARFNNIDDTTTCLNVEKYDATGIIKMNKYSSNVDIMIRNIGNNTKNKERISNNVSELYNYTLPNIYNEPSVHKYLNDTFPNKCNTNTCKSYKTHDIFDIQHTMFNNHTRDQLLNLNSYK
jgi:hypothetical protein